MPAAPATPSLAALGPALTASFTARTTSAAATATVLGSIVGARSASVRMTTELLATTEPAASPRSDLGLI